MDLKPIPCPITLPPEERSIEPVIEEFFEETKRAVLEKYPIQHPDDFRIRFRPLAHDFAQEHVHNLTTDDNIRYLTYQDAAVVATVFELRNDFNNVRYSFFRSLDNIDAETAQRHQRERREVLKDMKK